MSLLYEQGRILVWVDGACFNNHDRWSNRRAGYAVWLNEDHSWNEWGSVTNVPPTNQNAEIEAAVQAVKIVSNIYGRRSIEIHTDSMFLVKCVEEWIPNWRRNGWRRTNGEPVSNQVKLRELDRLIRSAGKKIFWEHIARDSEYGNVEADRLAKMGANGSYSISDLL